MTPLVVDADNVGFFRVRYAAPLFDALAARWPSLRDGTRLKLFADTSALVRADQAPLARWLALVERSMTSRAWRSGTSCSPTSSASTG